MNPAECTRARQLLAGAENVMIFTGSGVSAESGVPTFRGPGGLWKQFRPEELATPEAFARDPRLVWEWYAWRRSVVTACAPNPAHVAIADWMRRRKNVTLATQNVDDLHERAGTPAILKLHGSLFIDRCSRCDHMGPCSTVDTASRETLPRCPGCGALLRPAVVWFGETLPEDQLDAAFQAASRAQGCLVIGTTGAVYPAASIVHTAVRAGATVIVVDPAATEYDGIAGVRLVGKAGELIPQLLA